MTFRWALVYVGEDTCRISPGDALCLTQSEMEAHTIAYDRTHSDSYLGDWKVVKLPEPVEITRLSDTPGG